MLNYIYGVKYSCYKGELIMFNNGLIERDLSGNRKKLSESLFYEDKDMSNDQLINIIKDLTNKSDRQENFLLNIIHDLRGHLNVILSVMQCIDYGTMEIDNKKTLEYINIVKRNSLKMLKLVNNLIDTTKLENNYYVLNKKNIDIVSLIEDTVNCTDKYAKQKKIHLIFDTNKEECIVGIDPEAVDRVIMNLLSNAIKYSYEGTNVYINLFISKDNIKIKVRDEGPGICKKYQDKIFSRFYQISNDGSRESLGSGIGLDLVNYLIKSMGGDIILNSKEGEGSEFIITLPRCIVEEKIDYCLSGIDNKRIQMLEIEFSDIYNY